MKISIALLAVAASLVTAQDYGYGGSSSAAASGSSSSAAASSSAASSSAAASSAVSSASASGSASAASPSASASSSSSNNGGSSAQNVPPVTIPTSISSGCSSFLNTLNTASSIQSCLSPLLSSTSSVSSFCASAQSGACSPSSMRTWLTYFKGNCSDEVSSNDDVKSMYDTLYVTAPFVDAVCSKDANGAFCVSSGTSGSGGAQTPLMASNGMPDANAFSSNDILFLGANPKMTATELCTACTQKVMNAYFSFESSTPYASTLSQSPLLSSQNDLYTAIQKTCPANFLNSALGNVGAGPNGVNNGAPLSMAPLKMVGAVVAVAAAFMAL